MKVFSTIIAILLFFTFGCKKNNLVPVKEKNISIISGNNQSGSFNVPLSDSLVVLVTDALGNPLPREKVNHKSLYEKVGGSVRSPIETGSFTDSDGILSLSWKVYCYEPDQTLILYVGDSSLHITDSVIFKAQVGTPVGWAESCGIKEICQGYDEMTLRSFGDILYAPCKNNVYRSPNGGQDWEKIMTIPELMYYSSIFDIQFSREGWAYLVTTESGIHFSKDQISWENIGQINGHYKGNILSDFLQEDNFLFASYWEEGLKRSSNNGKSWENLSIHPSDTNIYKFINRHPNGDLYLFDQENTLWKSKDNGDSWATMVLDEKYVNSRVEDFMIGENGMLYIGANNASLSILSPDTYQGDLYQFQDPNNENQYVNNIQMIDGTVYFNVVGNATPGIYSSQNWERFDLGFEKPINSYFLKDDGSFLLRSDFGVFHFF